MNQFDHEKLDVYQIAIDWVSLAQDIAEALPGKGKGTLTDQLQRAASSIPLNIAEGAGEFSGAERHASTALLSGLPLSVPQLST